jgi:pilus assembly protein CpaE
MPHSSDYSRVLVISDPGPTYEQIASALGQQNNFQLVDLLTSMDRLARDVHAAEPDIILIDHTLGGQSTMEIIDDMALQFPDISIITILPNDDPVRAQQVTLAGARAFLIQPFTQVNLLSTLRRVRDLEMRRVLSYTQTATAVPETVRPLKTLAVFSPRGGVGVSTVATNLAVSIFEKTAKRVLLLEGKLLFGHLDVMLNIRAQNTMADLLPHAHNLDPNLVSEVVLQHASGVNVLLAPRNVQVGQGIRADDLFNVYSALYRLFDYIIIDAGSTLNENTVTFLDAADRILLVTTPDMASLHDTSMFIQISRTLAYPQDKMLVLLNRSTLQGAIKPKDIETALHHMIFAQLPDDGPNVLRSLNRGIPVSLQYGRSPVTKAFKELATGIVNLTAMEPVGEAVAAEGRGQRDMLLASSRLG